MLESQWYKKELENSDSDIKHRSLSEEYSFFEAVKDGNIEFVQKNCQEEAFSNPEGMGILSKNSLTNLKYHFVITVALVTRLFKQNLGVSISDYIREKKIEKAQNLLRFSDFTYVEIANYLSFSSQSHFIQTFEHYVGMTPKQYRSSKYKSTW